MFLWQVFCNKMPNSDYYSNPQGISFFFLFSFLTLVLGNCWNEGIKNKRGIIRGTSGGTKGDRSGPESGTNGTKTDTSSHRNGTTIGSICFLLVPLYLALVDSITTGFATAIGLYLLMNLMTIPGRKLTHESSKRAAWIVAFRAYLQLITCMCILAGKVEILCMNYYKLCMNYHGIIMAYSHSIK